jgi:hypothetical protein
MYTWEQYHALIRQHSGPMNFLDMLATFDAWCVYKRQVGA